MVTDPQRGSIFSDLKLSRRKALGVLAALALPNVARANPFSRIAAIDWAMLECLMPLGVTPIAATELIRFREDAVEPPIPSSVVDLGLRGSPNFELLYLLKPDLILSSPFYTQHEDALKSIAPIMSLPFYVHGEGPYAKSLEAVTALGEKLELSAKAANVIEVQAKFIAETKEALKPFASRPTYLINIGDARHFRAFGNDSMFGDVLERLGLPNAWTDRSRFTFAAPVPLENLAANPDARIIIISDIPVESRNGLRNSVIWRSLKPVREGRVYMLDNINPYGGITAGLRFARLLKDALQASGETSL
ncbi:iron-siderophore ABC transporter substrate-binding protein [Brucella pituitosa]|uniref:iron-siderophore ABC transporter substrate-binding protein n=1 Tax=Brucella pituitosa TaxID=571256 RepID=UPI000C27AC12|nr:iron-siderophore ABC transporter substrate-binding protein [Brucella pituitosa]MCK4206741.1 iron-siderophore ABC transporter substrate-binding protein [Brucella pituitosa]PJO49247.1 amino acid ABC transporter substrate-binding protein [Brucella pituitosa]PRA83963.1 amino acid ABC transporter substrate-binding protein [Ochrobactrum sp. MYb29]